MPSHVIYITQPDRVCPTGPSPFLFHLFPVNLNKCLNYYCATLLTSAQPWQHPPPVSVTLSTDHVMRGKLRAKERVCHLSIFAQARGWLSLCEFKLSQCLVDVNATHEMCVCVCVCVCVCASLSVLMPLSRCFCASEPQQAHSRSILISSPAISDATFGGPLQTRCCETHEQLEN